MGELFFNLHMLGAVATLASVVLAVRRLIKGGRYKTHVTSLAVVGSWQLITGIGLVTTTPGVSILRVCISGFVYLVVIGSIEALLVRRLQTASA